MDITQIFFISFLFILITTKLFLKNSTTNPNLPPSPPYPLPFIGHLHLLKHPIHRTLISISHSLNTPIFHLRLGNRLAYIISSNSIAEECFTKNDVVLANRPEIIMAKHVGYNSTNMITAPYGGHWRSLRRISATDIFSSHRIGAFMSIGKEEIRRLIMHLSRDSLHGFVEVEMKSLFINLGFNNITMMMAGKRYYGGESEDNEEAKVVRELISELTAGACAGNVAEYIPILRWVTNFENRAKVLGKRMDRLLQKLVDEKRGEKEKGETLIHRLLSLQETEPEYYTDVIIKGIMVVSLIYLLVLEVMELIY